MRKLVYYVASSLDGFIAHDDGSFSGFPWDPDYGAALLKRFPETFPVHHRPPASLAQGNRRFDTVLMGRKTYEVGLREGVRSPYPTLGQYLVSRSLRASPDEAVRLVREDAIGVVGELKQEPGKGIWLCGGSELATALFGAGLVDELIVKLNPVVFGSGIPLLGMHGGPTPLRLSESEVFPSGHAVLHYEVAGRDRGAPPP